MNNSNSFLQKSITLNATREQVFEAVGTGPGLSSWYVPHEFEPRKGGRVSADFGGGVVMDAVVLVYEPPRRVIYGGGEALPDVIIEFWTTSGGDEPGGAGRETTVLHLRQRGFPETDKAMFDRGWDSHLHTLQQYFEHFAGRPATTSVALTFPPLERREAWERMTRGLQADRDLAVGERVVVRGDLADEIAGEVNLRISDIIDVVGIRTDDGLLKMMADEQCGATLLRYNYVVDPPPDLRERVQNDLQGWLERQVAGGD